MEIISPTSKHEMEKRFAIGEIYSSWYPNATKQSKDNIHQLLTSGDIEQENDGFQLFKELGRGFYIESLPSDTSWHMAKIDMIEEDFYDLKTIKDSGWAKHLRNTYSLIEAANNIESNPEIDNRVLNIIDAFKNGCLELRGITLFSNNTSGPFTIVEGTGRLIALYLCCVKNMSTHCSNSIKAVYGISNKKWSFS